jgi:xanthine dehydrogenase YagS FAD-binding subunit
MRNFAIERPDTLESALALLHDRPDWSIMAGGTTLVDLMKLNVVAPEGIVDISSIENLEAFDTSGDVLKFGALARMSDVADDATLKSDAPVLSEALWKAASPQLRNAGRLGGNILQQTRCPYFRDPSYACNKREPGSGCAALDGGRTTLHALFGGSEKCIAMYPGDWAQALIAFDATVVAVSTSGTRRINFSDFHTLPGDAPHIETTLKPGELVASIEVPKTPALKSSHYLKARDRESYAFASASAAVGLALDGDTVTDARIALGGVASVPWRAREAEKVLKGKTFSEELARDAGEVAFDGAESLEGSAYKIELGKSVVAGALMSAHQRATGG